MKPIDYENKMGGVFLKTPDGREVRIEETTRLLRPGHALVVDEVYFPHDPRRVRIVLRALSIPREEVNHVRDY